MQASEVELTLDKEATPAKRKEIIDLAAKMERDLKVERLAVEEKRLQGLVRNGQIRGDTKEQIMRQERKRLGL